MGANASRRARRAAVLGEPLASFPTHYLEVDCGTSDCRRGRTFQVGSIAQHEYRGCTVHDFLRRLRCRDCGRPVLSAVLIGMVGVRRPQPVRLGLLGPEARD
jgi:hypothetical protein